jgi:aryl-alcohol dehydrogenase-like predicted oxidoreductase
MNERGWTVPESEAFFLLDAVPDVGLNFVDTADF